MWRYFVLDFTPTSGALWRRDSEETTRSAEILDLPSGEWRPSDVFFRIFAGHWDRDNPEEISARRADEIIRSWLASGRLSRTPQESPGVD
ncbi:hypothetical protein CLV30_104264 [Haloactinopolyspora alba]|uniref:Uncharacterized protein n=1 Tax=Haloactinopolyspora alba TaxID=648780 RepID=A0A2P8E7E6_9ACTN|nr:hypothetical protein CLV30_104264 [Haloactinopolyspora alba]